VPLTQDQLHHLVRRLHDERARATDLLNRIVGDRSRESNRDATGDLTVMPFHMADLGTDAMNAELDESNATRASTEIAEIDAALERIHTSPEQFGRCANSGREIPFARLDMIPWAQTCD
jgi:DnaK suppressor protein